jgi:hypothetical protein
MPLFAKQPGARASTGLIWMTLLAGGIALMIWPLAARATTLCDLRINVVEAYSGGFSDHRVDRCSFAIPGAGQMRITYSGSPYMHGNTIYGISFVFAGSEGQQFPGRGISVTEDTVAGQPFRYDWVQEFGPDAAGFPVDAALIGRVTYQGGTGNTYAALDYRLVVEWLDAIETMQEDVVSLPPPVDLVGNWVVYIEGRLPAQSSIDYTGNGLEFIIYRNPEQRSAGRFLDDSTVVADDWDAQVGQISADGRRIDWPGSWWIRTD